jgi:hypothetical protein
LSTYILSLFLINLGIVGTATLIILTGTTIWNYRGSPMRSFRWHMRNIRLKQLSAVACLFFLAMSASYALLQDIWGIVYLIAALKTGTWWLRMAISQRA